MPIDVQCPGCKTRFKVGDQHAGKKGNCPKCKVLITVPDKPAPEVKIHAPEASGPKDSQGNLVLKPISRRAIRFSPVVLGTVIGTLVLAMAGALVGRVSYQTAAPKAIPGKVVSTRSDVPVTWLGVGAILIAPSLCWAGYQILRDDELEPYRGRELLLRVLLCSVAYAALWAVYWGVKISLLENQSPETWQTLYVLPPFVLVGGIAGLACFGLNYGAGMFHYGLYLLVSIVLRWLANVGTL
jgi:predicted Zn finger-like uncharacterized protein